MPAMSPERARARGSALCMPMRLGTSSPKTRVKKDSSRVMRMTTRVSRVFSGRGTPRPSRRPTRGSEK